MPPQEACPAERSEASRLPGSTVPGVEMPCSARHAPSSLSRHSGRADAAPAVATLRHGQIHGEEYASEATTDGESAQQGRHRASMLPVEIDTGVAIAVQILAAIDSPVARLPFVMALDADASLTYANTTIDVALAGVAVPNTADALPADALAEHQGNGAAVVPALARFAQTLAPALLLLTNLLAHVGTTIGRLLAFDALPLA